MNRAWHRHLKVNFNYRTSANSTSVDSKVLNKKQSHSFKLINNSNSNKHRSDRTEHVHTTTAQLHISHLDMHRQEVADKFSIVGANTAASGARAPKLTAR